MHPIAGVLVPGPAQAARLDVLSRGTWGLKELQQEMGGERPEVRLGKAVAAVPTSRIRTGSIAEQQKEGSLRGTTA